MSNQVFCSFFITKTRFDKIQNFLEEFAFRIFFRDCENKKRILHQIKQKKQQANMVANKFRDLLKFSDAYKEFDFRNILVPLNGALAIVCIILHVRYGSNVENIMLRALGGATFFISLGLISWILGLIGSQHPLEQLVTPKYVEIILFYVLCACAVLTGIFIVYSWLIITTEEMDRSFGIVKGYLSIALGCALFAYATCALH